MAAALAAYYIRPTRASLTGIPLLPAASLPNPPAAEAEAGGEGGEARPRLTRQASATGIAPLVELPPVVVATSTQLPLAPLPSTRSLDLSSGEYRGIMALCR